MAGKLATPRAVAYRTNPAEGAAILVGVTRALAVLIVPEGLLLLAAAMVVPWPAALDPFRAVMPYVPAIAWLAGTGLAVRFQRTDAVLALLALLGLGIVSALTGYDRHDTAVILATTLLPANLLVFAVLPERGLASGAAARRAGALALQGALVLVLARPDQAAQVAPLVRRTLTFRLDASVGDLGVLLYLAAGLVLALLVLRQAHALHRGILWALVAAFLASLVPPGRHVGGIPAPLFLLTVAVLSVTVAVIENAYALAYRDALTGLPNRRAFDDALGRLRAPFAVAMIDVDKFKLVNDTHGHDVGDQILRMVAAQLEDTAGPGRPFRYGGEEFALLFRGRSAQDVLPTLEAVREAVAAAGFTLRGGDRPKRRPKRPRQPSGATRLQVTISAGVAGPHADDPHPDAAVARADQALYRAKRRGRNRVEAARAG